MNENQQLVSRLLSLYPADFRKQFSEEMLCVFEQRASERFARSAPVGFVLAEVLKAN
jgi:hypothetical protein